jgi:hypothetical protein
VDAEAFNAMLMGVQWTLAIGFSSAVVAWGARVIVELIGEAIR